MSRNLSFGQKLGLGIGCALLLQVATIVCIGFYYSKNGPPKDLDRLINREVFYSRYYEERDWLKEEQSAGGQISIHPKSAYWYAKRGQARWHLSNYEGAFKDYDTAVKLDPRDYNSLACRASLRETIGGNHEQAMEDANKAISIRANDGWLYATRARLYFNQRDYDLALKDTTNA